MTAPSAPSPNSLDVTVHPARALLTPAWLGALALLVANDHWLKGADLIPGVLTGKLSDVAGMIVAPALLATLLRVGTRRGLLACHLAVGAVFAGIQISAGFAALWSEAMGLLGHPWVITSDLGDLLALPVLLLSWHALRPAMEAEGPALIGLQRSAVAAASMFGLWATVATSDDSAADEGCWACWDETGGWDEGGEGDWQDVSGQVYLHNPNEFAISLNIRVLRSDVHIDCDAIASDPGRLLPDEVFATAELWELPPTTNVAVRSASSCLVAKVAGEGIPEQILFSTVYGGTSTFEGSHEDLNALGPHGAAISFGTEGEGGEWVGGANWRFSPDADTPALPEGCEGAPGERHLDWSKLPPQLSAEVLAVTEGFDGCFELELLPFVGGSNGEPFTWYLCAPASSVRMNVGETFFMVAAGGGSFVEARLADPVTHEALVDEQGRNLRTLRWERGLNSVHMPYDLQASTELRECPWTVDEDCLDVTRRLDLYIGPEAIEAVPGETTVYVDEGGMRHELSLGRARAVALNAGQCSGGLPEDIDYALVSEPSP